MNRIGDFKRSLSACFSEGKLRCHRRPVSIAVRAVKIDAVQTRTIMTADDRANGEAAITVGDRQMRDVTTEPAGGARRLDDVMAEDDSEIDVGGADAVDHVESDRAKQRAHPERSRSRAIDENATRWIMLPRLRIERTREPEEQVVGLRN